MTRPLVLGLTVLLATTSSGRADTSHIADKYLPIGILATAQSHPGIGGLGIEISYVQYVANRGSTFINDGLGIGPYLQVQMVGVDNHARGALGIQLNYFVAGLEAALAVEGTNGESSTTLFADITPYLSIGYCSVGVRIGVPLAAVDQKSPYGTQVAGVFTLKWPIPLNGPHDLIPGR